MLLAVLVALIAVWARDNGWLGWAASGVRHYDGLVADNNGIRADVSYQGRWTQEGRCESSESYSGHISDHTNRQVVEHHDYQHITPHTQGPAASLWVNVLGVLGLEAQASSFVHVPGRSSYHYGGGYRGSDYGRTYGFSQPRYYGARYYGGGSGGTWVTNGYHLEPQYIQPRRQPLPSRSGLRLNAGPSRYGSAPSSGGLRLNAGPTRSNAPSGGSLHLNAGSTRSSVPSGGGLNLRAGGSGNSGGGGLQLRAGHTRH